jgi:hypothetical protein
VARTATRASTPPPDTSADRIGQAAEWLVWTQLTVGSPLHVFLPLRDMGIDAVVHVPGTDVSVAVQVKSRHVLEDGKLHLLVRDHELRDPRAVIVAVVYDSASRALNDTAICVDVPTFRDLAFPRRGSDHGYQASIPYPPPPGTRWHPFATALDSLAARICPTTLPSPAPPLLSPPLPVDHGSDVGYRAEARLLALLAEDARLNSFKAFPDLEMAEYLVRHVDTGVILAIQVKAVSVDADHPRRTVKVPPGTFRPTPSTHVTVFAEHRDDRTAHPVCLLIPSTAIGDLLDEHADGELTLSWDPDSTRHDAGVAPYRCPTTELPGRIAALLERDSAIAATT